MRACVSPNHSERALIRAYAILTELNMFRLVST